MKTQKEKRKTNVLIDFYKELISDDLKEIDLQQNKIKELDSTNIAIYSKKMLDETKKLLELGLNLRADTKKLQELEQKLVKMEAK